MKQRRVSRARKEMDWRSLQSLCHQRLLALQERPLDGLCTLRSLRWAVDLLEQLNSSADEFVVPNALKVPECETPARNASVLFGSQFKRKSGPEEVSAGERRPRRPASVCRTERRIEARLANPHISILTNFVSYCMLMSLDQQPAVWEVGTDVQHPDIEGGMVEGTYDPLNFAPVLDTVNRGDAREGASSLGNNMWLYKWLVKTLLWVPTKDAGGGGSHEAGMDWLVAYLTIGDPPGVIQVTFEDLACELCDSSSSEFSTLAIYTRRISIFEFAALRMPEQLRTVVLSSPHVSDEMHGMQTCPNNMELRSTDRLFLYIPSIWLVLTSISRCLLSASTQFWVPCNKMAGEWLGEWLVALLGQCDTTKLKFPVISDVFEDTVYQGLQGAKIWMCALVKARLLELTPLATDIVVLLYSNAQSLKTKRDEKLAELSSELLEVIVGQLTESLLPKCLGSYSCRLRSPSPEVDGSVSFMDNLKQNVDRLWNALVESSFPCICASCDGVQDDFSLLVDPSRDLCLCHLMRGESTKVPGFSHSHHPCWRKTEAAFSGLFHLVIMCSEESIVTDIMVQATAINFRETGNVDTKSLKQLCSVLNVLRVLVAQDSMQHVLKGWARKLSRSLRNLDNEKISSMMAALKVLLLPATWKAHAFSSKLITGSELKQDDDCGLAWKPAWNLVRKVLDCEWRTFITMLNRHHAWDMKWSVLGVLQLLPPDIECQSQGVILRLRSALGFFFSLLQGSESNQSRNTPGSQRWWKHVRVIEQLKDIIVDHATRKSSCFVLMVHNILDFSFIVSGSNVSVTTVPIQQREEAEPCSCNAQVWLSETPNGSSAAMATVPTSGNRVAQYGASRASRPLLQSHIVRREASQFTIMVANELGSVLKRAIEKVKNEARQPCHLWPSHPAAILATIIMSRLETPHELPMSMEQYEEVLPRHVSSPRHTYLVECFRKNLLLFEILELVFEHGGQRELAKCAELVRTLLADWITRFHSSFRVRSPSSPATVEGAAIEVLERIQVSRLIHVVWLSGWLPESLACSKEVVHAIDGAFIPDLLLLVWRCMHDALAAALKAWDGNQTESVKSFGVSKAVPMQYPSISENSGWRSAQSQTWEDSLQSILRHNIVQVSVHLAHIYPGRG